MRAINYKSIIATFLIALLLVFSSGCVLYKTITPSPIVYASTVPNLETLAATQNAHLTQTAQAFAGLAQAPESASVVGTVRPTDVVKVMFAEADCPVEGFTGLEANYGLGGLDCRYHWMGPHSAENLQLTIMQIPDPQKYQQIIQSDMEYQKTSLLTVQSAISDGSPYKNDSLDIIKDSPTENIYVRTYEMTTNYDGTDVTELCADGYGTMAVDDQFQVTLQMPGVCGLYTTAQDYSRLMMTMRDAALTAIENAQANISR